MLRKGTHGPGQGRGRETGGLDAPVRLEFPAGLHEIREHDRAVRLRHLGLDLSQGYPFKPSTTEYSSNTIGFHMGVFLVSSRSTKAGFRLEMLFASRKAQQEVVENVAYVTYSQTQQTTITKSFSYLEIPLLLSFQPVKRLALHLGASPCMLMDATSSSESSTTFTLSGGTPVVKNDKLFQSISSQLSPVVIDGLIGLSYDLPMGLHFGARYAYDLNNIATGGDSASGTGNTKVHFGRLQFSLGYCFLGRP